MTWRFIKVEDARMEFIMLSQKNVLNFKQLCEQFGISRKTGYKWLARYHEGGVNNLSDRNRIPKYRPNETCSSIVELILDSRKNFPFWGPKKIIPHLQKEHPNLVFPSIATVGNILRRNGYSTKPKLQAKLAKSSPLINAKYSNHVWTIDFKGWWKVGDKQVCEPLTIVDLYSKYLLHVDHINRRTTENVWRELIELFKKYGKPAIIRSDNGPPFASQGVGRLSKLSINLIKNGITPQWIRPGKPQDNGSHERMHRTLKAEVAMDPAPTLPKQRIQLSEFKDYFNNIRPHEALNMNTPSKIFKPIDRSVGHGKLLCYPEEYLVRKVGQSGQISVYGYQPFISEMLRGETLGLSSQPNQKYDVYYGPIFIGSLDLLGGFKKF